jgi:hypothetical protein
VGDPFYQNRDSLGRFDGRSPHQCGSGRSGLPILVGGILFILGGAVVSAVGFVWNKLKGEGPKTAEKNPTNPATAGANLTPDEKLRDCPTVRKMLEGDPVEPRNPPPSANANGSESSGP